MLSPSISGLAGRFLAIASALLPFTFDHLAAQQRNPVLTAADRATHSSHVTTTQVRDALGLSAADVVSINFGLSDHSGFDVFSTAATSFPAVGSTYFVMSSGNTSSALMANTSESTSTVLSGLDNSQGNDLTQITLVLTPPMGASCLAFDFQFFSEEFPEFVGSQFNDAFIAEIDQGSPTPFQIVDDQIIAPDNFAFDTDFNVVSINTAFGVTSGAAAGTTYDGATPILTAVTPLETPGAQITITLSIMDLGDSIFDSTAFIDNFRWFFGLSCEAGADADSDGDSLLDDWEINGIDFDNDGIVDLDLPAFGADPMHKDVFIEIDYMVLTGTTGHTHEPKSASLQIFIDSFANAPVSNPDGTTGITAHIDAGSTTIMDPVANTMWGSRSQSDVLTHQNNLGSAGGSYNWTAFDVIKGVSFAVQRADVFHYCIFGHALDTGRPTTSGISRGISASDFLVTLGGWTTSPGTVNQQGGTLMHEFGHNLNLLHGGDASGSGNNRKPNYLSIMSYSFQMRGLRIGGVDGNFDYSRFVLPNLTEATLDETVGLSGVAEATGYGTRYYDPFGALPPFGPNRIVNSLTSIDWDGDSDALDNPVAVNINGAGGLTTLTGFDDWDAIVFDGGSVGHLGEAIVLPAETVSNDITEEVDLLIPTDFSVCIAGPGHVGLEVCQVETYEYTITNTGDNPDIYVIATTSTQGFGDLSVFPTILPLGSGVSAVFHVEVSIPENASTGTIDEVEIVVTSSTNMLILDVAKTTTEVVTPTDTDGDGFPNFCDACPDSDLRSTIWIDGRDSGVTNQHLGDGCFMTDLILECAANATNHGGFASCVSGLTNGWQKDGLIGGREKGAIQQRAAQAKIPH